MTPEQVCELQRMHARWYRMARDLHRTITDYPGEQTPENTKRMVHLQEVAAAFSFAARLEP